MIRIQVVICSIDYINKHNVYLLEDHAVITRPMNMAKQPWDIVIKTVQEFFIIDKHWLKPILSDVYVYNEIMYILYTIMVPYYIDKKKGDWVNQNEIFQLDNKFEAEVIKQAASKIG